MCKRALLLLLVILPALVQAQNAMSSPPKLVVGITIDQMRQEYLYRYAAKFSRGGFNRLMNDGFSLRNAHYNYVPTVTGPGHASIYGGTTPAIHGIIGNDWYDKIDKHEVNCVNDPRQKPVGSANGGAVSPWRMLSSTITDELKIATEKKAKVFGISIKDRGAVLPAGHMGDGAFWYDTKSGKLITSTFYSTRLPDWMERFNQRNLPDQLLNQVWTPLLPINQYTESGPDDSPYERKFEGKEKATFPYNLAELRKTNDNFDLLSFTPFANDYLTEAAKACIDAERLGADQVPDFLSVSYSATDILGHHVGPHGVELQDMYLRLDRNIEDLLKFLDARVGNGNYVVFFTSDHAVADVAQYMRDSRMPAGYFSSEHVKAKINEFMKQYFPGGDVVEAIDGCNVFLNHDLFRKDPRSSGVDFMVASELVTNYLLAQEGVANVYSESVIRQGQYNEEGIRGMVVRGFNPAASGDLVLILKPGWYDATKVAGTSHGSPYSYDTHVPVLFYGRSIPKGSTVEYHPITDIAPTISLLLNIKFPSGCTGKPIADIFE